MAVHAAFPAGIAGAYSPRHGPVPRVAGWPYPQCHALRAARADLFDVRNNASDGIHGASAGGLWQAAVFGFAGLTFNTDKKTWTLNPSMPKGWKRIAFKFHYQGKVLEFDTNKR